MSFWQNLLQRFFPFRGSVYRRIGGQKAITQLVDDFYHVMETDPKARECLLTHQGRDLAVAGEKLKAFLAGWLGGPQLYMEKYGHPRLRARHHIFTIGTVEAQQWLYCMEEALKKSTIDHASQQQMMEAFRGLTEVIKNRD